MSQAKPNHTLNSANSQSYTEAIRQAARLRLELFAMDDMELIQTIAANCGNGGDKLLKHHAALELTRRVNLQHAIDELEKRLGRD